MFGGTLHPKHEDPEPATSESHRIYRFLLLWASWGFTKKKGPYTLNPKPLSRPYRGCCVSGTLHREALRPCDFVGIISGLCTHPKPLTGRDRVQHHPKSFNPQTLKPSNKDPITPFRRTPQALNPFRVSGLGIEIVQGSVVRSLQISGNVCTPRKCRGDELQATGA